MIFRKSKLFNQMTACLPDWMYLALRHRLSLGRWPSLATPEHFNEHILQMIVSREDAKLRTMFADKIAVRQYVEEQVGAEFLPKVHKIWDGSEALSLNDLPDAFVAKPSHASGLVRLVDDRSEVDPAELEQQFRDWLKVDFYKAAREYVYKDLPRQIMFEEFLKPNAYAGPPIDYKFYVFDGVVRLVEVHLDRFIAHKQYYYDTNWKHVYVVDRNAPGKPGSSEMKRPENLDLMIEIAEKLSSKLNFLRVDLYDIDGRIVFGELTNFPQGGNMQFIPEEFGRYLGRFFQASNQSGLHASG